MKNALMLVGLGLLSLGSFAEEPLLSLLAKPAVTSVKISPGGEYLAVRMLKDDRYVVRFFDRKSRSALSGFNMNIGGGRSQVGDFWWVNEERIVGQVWQAPPGTEKHFYYGELFATNFDGTESELLFGYRSGLGIRGLRQKEKTGDNAWAGFIDIYPPDPRKVLISKQTFSDAQDKKPYAKLLDVYTGVEPMDVLVTANHASATFHADEKGELRLVVSKDADRSTHVQYRSASDFQWRSFPANALGRTFVPLAIDSRSESVNVLSDFGADKVGLYRYSFESQEKEKIYVHETVDVSEVLESADERMAYALLVFDGVPSYVFLDTSTKESRVFRSLVQTFPGYLIEIVSRSDDDRYWVLMAHSDTDPGKFYLFDSIESQITALFSAYPDLDGEALVPMQPVEFDSDDGLRIHGYFTPGKVPKGDRAPMLVWMHRLSRSRDIWEFQPMVQSFAAQGISVLQINPRGSVGYGNAFEKAGNLQWGDAVQRDLITGTRWAIKSGIATEGQVCIGGVSYGAYSAVMSAILAQDQFRCVIAVSGFYDLSMLYDTGQQSYLYGGKSYFLEAIGDDADQLRSYSPVYHVDKLKAPVLLAHGKKDRASPFQHAVALRRALKKHQKIYEELIRDGEVQGFNDPENKVELIRRGTEFIREHTGSTDVP